jgi:hypothetical protein
MLLVAMRGWREACFDYESAFVVVAVAQRIELGRAFRRSRQGRHEGRQLGESRCEEVMEWSDRDRHLSVQADRLACRDQALLHESIEALLLVPAGETRSVPTLFNHAQRGDPGKLAAPVVDLPDAAEPPLRLQLGPDAVESVKAKLDQVRRELDEWRGVALSTDSEDVETP